jgi:hypothetical protein
MRRIILLPFLLLFLGDTAQLIGQVNAYRQREITVQSDTIQLDSLMILPGSFVMRIQGDTVDASRFRVDWEKAQLILYKASYPDSISVSYQVMWWAVGHKWSHREMKFTKDPSERDPLRHTILSSDYNVSNDFGAGLNTNGTITRGIQIGNQQSVSVNSSLNLQLTGLVGNRYQLTGAITDDNIPLQPEGTTSRLQDFDQVFIRLQDDRTEWIAGDFQIERPNGYFMNYFKRAQGAFFRYASDDNQWKAQASASVSKGRFARNILQGVEGNQGPYRLSGSDGETFVIVLAGTEQVFIDGRLLQRGLDQDYTIDYNAAEITFTAKQMITKDRRIIVEFQYSEKRYARPLIQASVGFNGESNRAYVNVYSEGDAKNQPLQQELSDTDRSILAQSGDAFQAAFRSGVDSTGYIGNAVMYAMVDSLGMDSVFVAVEDTALSIYQVSFSFVGIGRGDYIEDGFTANGKKYKWIAPINGMKQGSYAPVVLLAAPQKAQMITAGVQHVFKTERASWLKVEGAISNRDLNTFSSRDQSDDVGAGVFVRYALNEPVSDTSSSRQKDGLYVLFNYEYTQRNFRFIERYREVEFSRNWNLSNLNVNVDQHIPSLRLGWNDARWGRVAVGTDACLLPGTYQGYRAVMQTDISTDGGYRMHGTGSYLQTSGLVGSTFVKHRMLISQEIGKWRIAYKDDQEWNQQWQADTLLSSSYSFFDWEGSVGTKDTIQKSFRLYYRDRYERRPSFQQLKSASVGSIYGAEAALKLPGDGRLGCSIANRFLKVTNPEWTTGAPENSLVGRVDFSQKWWKGAVQYNAYYEVGTGLEQRREFIYLEVPPGQGVYVWNDYNEDGIKDLSEFEVAAFGYEANYIRYSIQSNQYVRAYSNQLNQSITWNPARVLRSDQLSLLKRFSGQTTWRTERKTTGEEGWDRLNPFLLDSPDSVLLTESSLIRNAVFFNKTSPVFGLELTQQSSRIRTLLSNGFEERADENLQFGFRWTTFGQLTAGCEILKGLRSVASDFLIGRNYQLDIIQITPKCIWQPNTEIRLELKGTYGDKRNRIGLESAVSHRLSVETAWNATQKHSFRMQLEWVRIAFQGDGNSAIAYDMMEGLVSGNNATWSMLFQKTISKHVQMQFVYQGRKSERREIVHSGSVQVRAFF